MDITKEPMEVGPTCHYVMGGVRVDADSTAATVPGLFAAGEVAGGMHGSNRLGGNSPRRPARLRPARGPARRALLPRTWAAGSRWTRARWSRSPGPCSSPSRAPAARTRTRSRPSCRRPCSTLVGIIRVEARAARKRSRSSRSSSSARRKVRVEGGRVYNPGWHTALDLASLLTVAECCALAALERKESRGGHTREDHPVHRRHVGDRQPGRPAAGRPRGPAARAAAPDAARAQGPLPGEEVMPNFTMRVFRGDPAGGEFKDYKVESGGGHGRARRHPPHPGHPGPGPGLPVELQGGQVRLVQRGDQRQAAPHVHDPDGHLQGRRADLGGARSGPSRSSGTSSPTSRTTTRRPSRCRRSGSSRRTRTASTG